MLHTRSRRVHLVARRLFVGLRIAWHLNAAERGWLDIVIVVDRRAGRLGSSAFAATWFKRALTTRQLTFVHATGAFIMRLTLQRAAC